MMADEKKKGLFSPKPAPPPPAASPDRLNEVFARLRVDEQRSAELRKKLLFIEQNVLSNHRSASSQIKSLQNEITEVKRKVQDVEDNIMKIIKELKLTARKEDIDVVRRYVELWDPVKFVTVDTVDRIIDEKLGRAPERNIIEEEIVEPKEEVVEEVEPGKEAIEEQEVVEPEVDEAESEESGGEDDEQDTHGEETAEKSSGELDSMFESLVKKHSDRNV